MPIDQAGLQDAAGTTVLAVPAAASGQPTPRSARSGDGCVGGGASLVHLPVLRTSRMLISVHART